MIDCSSALSRIDSSTLSPFSRKNTHPRALLYEKLSKYYLLSSPLWKDEIKDAWLWGDPNNPLNSPSCPRPDFGIDVVALGVDGNYWSCQVKERSTSFSSLSWRDLSTFASASEHFAIPPFRRILFLFSSSLSSNSLPQTKDYKVITEDSMEKEGIDFAPFFEEGALKGAEKENSRLRPYQVDAVEKCMEGFEKESKGQLIMACGTGKTITGLAIAEEMAKRKEGPFFSLCLVPSIQLLTQTLLYWKKHSSFPFFAQAVCSDNGANGEENSPSYLEERNIPRVAKTAEDILSPCAPFTSLFCTYPSLPKVIEAQKMGRIPAFDLCIADEAHRTASKNLWGKIHFGGLRSEKTLFMTATPRLKEEGEGPFHIPFPLS